MLKDSTNSGNGMLGFTEEIYFDLEQDKWTL